MSDIHDLRYMPGQKRFRSPNTKTFTGPRWWRGPAACASGMSGCCRRFPSREHDTSHCENDVGALDHAVAGGVMAGALALGRGLCALGMVAG